MPVDYISEGSEEYMTLTGTASAEKLEDLIRAVAGGSTDALAELYDAASAAVYSLALSILRNGYDAEDALHDTFVSIWEGAPGYRPKGKPMAWILTIARNHSLKGLRARGKTAELAPEFPEYRPAETGLSADDKVVLSACMERLSDEERQIVVLHAVAGFRHREIAGLLELPLSTVLSKYHRAIQKLRNDF